MDLEGLINEHDAIFAKLQPMRDKNREISQLRMERDSFNNKIRALNKEVKELQKKRDAFNKKVQESKADRDKLNAQTKKIRGSYKDLFDQNKQTNFRDLERKVKNIHWQIQTAGMSFENEKKLRKQLESMEKLYNAHKVFNDSKKTAETKHSSVLEFSTKSEEIHEELIKLYARIKEVRTQADAKHDEVVSALKAVEEMEETHADDVKRLQELKVRITETKAEKKTKQEEEKQASFKERAKDAMAKFAAGKRVDLRDLQLSFGMEEKKKEGKGDAKVGSRMPERRRKRRERQQPRARNQQKKRSPPQRRRP